MITDIQLIAEPPLSDLRYIMHNLRDYDRLECQATSFSDNPDDWADALAMAGAFQWAVYLNGTPTVTLGAMPRWPGNWNGWCLGTADFPRVALTVTKHIMRFMLPALRATPGFRRLDALAVESYKQTPGWLALTGAQLEATLANWGKNGETFLVFTWSREATKPMVRTAMADMRDDPHGLPVL